LTELDKIKQLLQFNKFLEAEKLLKKLILNAPQNFEQLMLLAGLYRSVGKFNEAKETYRRIIELDSTYTAAYRLLIDFLDENELSDFEKKINTLIPKKISDEKLVDLYFSLGILNEKLKKYKLSSDYFTKANNLKRKIKPFNFNNLDKHFQNLKNVFSKLSFKKINYQNQKKIIFIIGLPRSGTSLVESILGSNKNIYTAGEIPNLKRVIRENFVSDGLLDFVKINNKINNKDNSVYDHYINDTNLKNIKENVITDKNTENFKFLGIINTFFTNSKIINCVRDPFENFCSLYKINFNSSGLNWTNSKKDIFMYYKNYFELIDLWKSKNFNNIIDLKFEELLSDPVNTINKLIDFCELDRNDDYINFHNSNSLIIKTASANQARKPIQKENIYKYKYFKDYFDFN
jgi:tetratricopeptide (TPR) repeat protein